MICAMDVKDMARLGGIARAKNLTGPRRKAIAAQAAAARWANLGPEARTEQAKRSARTRKRTKPRRTIKAAAGKSKVTQDEATDAAKRTR